MDQRTADIRVGVVGSGRGMQLANVLRTLEGVRIVALCDIDPVRAEQAAAELAARPFTDFADFLASGLDAVVIASPIPAHAAQVETALAAGVHVLCEVLPCSTIDQARRLVEVVRASSATYMLAENFCSLGEVLLLRQLYAEGRFGEVYYAESDHLLNLQDLWRTDDGRLAWRGTRELGVYCTHSLGPLLSILDDRVAFINALTVPGGKFDPEVTIPTMYLLQMATVGGVAIQLRVDLTSPRPHLGYYYALQGTRGSYESWRGLGDAPKVWLADAHGPSSLRRGAQWHPLAEQAPRYLPGREASLIDYAGTDRPMLEDWLATVRGEMPSPIDVYRGLDYTLPGLLADESAAQRGAPVAVPDPRAW
jgi:predicted dehydrogenase